MRVYSRMLGMVHIVESRVLALDAACARCRVLQGYQMHASAMRDMDIQNQRILFLVLFLSAVSEHN